MILASTDLRFMHSPMRIVAPIILIVSVLAGCTFQFEPKDATVEETKIIPLGSVSPELDHSSESPVCEVAAQRIADNIQIGMAQKDVRRLVGQPRLVLPGTWYWSRGFSKEGLPLVRFKTSRADNTVTVASFSVDSSAC